jgi:apolipoprotein N-acyltransferase
MATMFLSSSPKRLLVGIVLALSTSFLLIISFPRSGFSQVIWFAFVPLWISILLVEKRFSFILGFLSGLGYFIGVSPWVWDIVTWKAALLAYGYLSLYFGIPAWLVRVLYSPDRRLVYIVGPAWILFEYLRSNLFFLSFPAAIISHSQYHNLGLLQIVTWAGSYGLSFLIMTVNGALADGFFSLLPHFEDYPAVANRKKFRTWLPALTASLTVALVWISGSLIIAKPQMGTPLTVSVVHGNIPQDKKWDPRYREEIISRFERLSQEASLKHPQLIVWPETATPGFVLGDRKLLIRIGSLVRNLDTYLLLGSAEYPKFANKEIKYKESGNTALLFSPAGQIHGQYIKTKLVPFTEYVPAKGIIPWPEFIVPQKKAMFHISNRDINLLQFQDFKMGSLICWEILFPEFTRQFIQKGAYFLINISNEAWFRRGGVPTIVLAASVFRAVENRTIVIRSTNYGISGFIDPYGRLTGSISEAKSGTDFKGTTTATVHLSPPGTFYTAAGDLIVYLSLAYLAIILLWRFKR